MNTKASMMAGAQVPRVFAIVVTRNRMALLQRCITALRVQTAAVEAIIVVDNDSTDGTRQWLLKQSSIQSVFQQNLGSAGGQSSGMKVAYDSGAEWAWIMDDDGFPSEDCLARLFAFGSSFEGVIAPLVVDSEKPSKLAFEFNVGEGKSTWSVVEVEDAAVEGVYYGKTTMFNGPLIHRSVIERVGYPESNMFIWGDEWEYFLRLKKRNIRMVLIVGARFSHPSNRVSTLSAKFGRKCWSINWSENEERWLIMVRNSGFILRRHGKLIQVMRFLLKGIVLTLLKGKPLLSLKFFRALLCGWQGYPGKGLEYTEPVP